MGFLDSPALPLWNQTGVGSRESLPARLIGQLVVDDYSSDKAMFAAALPNSIVRLGPPGILRTAQPNGSAITAEKRYRAAAEGQSHIAAVQQENGPVLHLTNAEHSRWILRTRPL